MTSFRNQTTRLLSSSSFLPPLWESYLESLKANIEFANAVRPQIPQVATRCRRLEFDDRRSNWCQE